MKTAWRLIAACHAPGYCSRRESEIMRLLIIRHGIARDQQEFAKTGRVDALRPLTHAGKKKMRGAARGLKKVVPEISILATSPLTRAVQTAKIVGNKYDLKHLTIASLSPRKPFSQLLEWLQKNAEPTSTIAIVGHEPHLSTFTGWMLTGLKETFITLKKGGAILLEMEGEIKAGRAKLVWSLPPCVFRRIGQK
jgi:phosphohistidine phosphatase